MLSTAPTSKRFPTTNQAKACYMCASPHGAPLIRVARIGPVSSCLLPGHRHTLVRLPARCLAGTTTRGTSASTTIAMRSRSAPSSRAGRTRCARTSGGRSGSSSARTGRTRGRCLGRRRTTTATERELGCGRRADASRCELIRRRRIRNLDPPTPVPAPLLVSANFLHIASRGLSNVELGHVCDDAACGHAT